MDRTASIFFAAVIITIVSRKTLSIHYTFTVGTSSFEVRVAGGPTARLYTAAAVVTIALLFTCKLLN
jgi:hypothetical protein